MRYKEDSKAKKVLKKLAKGLFALFLVGVVVAVSGAFYVLKDAEKIDPTHIYEEISKNSYIYDADGNLISALNFGEDREIVPIDEMPDNLKNAFIAVEDKTFYEHHGVNYKRIVGAIWDSMRNDSSIGGTSTITQQLARNVYLPEEKSIRSIKRKLTEIWYAWQIEKKLSKDEILEAYLNAIYLGYGAYGVDSAADTYFSKEVHELNLTECVALAALPQAPDTYALLKDEGETRIKGTKLYANDTSKDRRGLILSLMVEQGYITSEEAESAKKDLVDFIRPNLEHKDSKYTYFNDYVIKTVIRDLIDLGKSEQVATEMVYTGGLRIYTTIRPEIQKIVYSEFQDDSNFPWAPEEPEAAMVIVENKTGKVLAMMGGRKPQGEKLFNRAVSPRQPGSSIKPISVYGAALQKSLDYAVIHNPLPLVNYGTDSQGVSGWGDYITAGSRVTDEKMYFEGKLWPENATRRFTGYQTFRTALQQSINTCAVKIGQQIGVEYSIQTLKQFGISTLIEEGSINDVNLASMCLGAMSEGVTPLDMAIAYSVFPNGGVKSSAVCYTEVKDREGNVLLTNSTQSKEAIDPGVAFIMTDILQSAVSKGIAKNAAIKGVSVGGKTGTTNDNYDIWFDGFTPKYSAALWIGTDKNTEMPNSSSTTAAALWSKIMSQINDITFGEYPRQPQNVIRYGKEYYTKDTEPGAYQAYLAEIKRQEELRRQEELEHERALEALLNGQNNQTTNEEPEEQIEQPSEPTESKPEENMFEEDESAVF